MLTTAQFFLLAGVGHATLNEGVTEKIHQTNHAIHLICAAAWFGGLLPVLWCMQLIKGRWRHQTIQALMRFSWCGHFAVIGVLASGVLNALLITGFHAYDLLGPTLIAQSHPGDDYGGHCAG